MFSKDKLMEVVKSRGYVTERAVADRLAPIFGLSSKTVEAKIRYGKLSMAECEVIGSFFEMTMKEYYDTFMNGLFVENQDGHYVCHVENPYLYLHPKVRMMTKPKTKKEKRKQILDEIDSL